MATLCKLGRFIFGAVFRVPPPGATTSARWASTEFSSHFQPPPKKPPNAYILFCKEKLSGPHDAYPDRSYRDIIREIGALWSRMSESDKERYKQLRDVQMKQWDVDYQAFLNTLPDKDEYLKQLKTFREKRRQRLKIFRERKHNKLTKPPRKLSAYNIYVRDQVAGAPREEIQTRLTEAAQSWKTLSEVEKAGYEQEAKQIHDHEMEEFNNRVTEESYSA